MDRVDKIQMRVYGVYRNCIDNDSCLYLVTDIVQHHYERFATGLRFSPDGDFECAFSLHTYIFVEEVAYIYEGTKEQVAKRLKLYI